MSGGRRIDDHSFWAGGKPAGRVFPDGPHKTKEESSAEGSGHVSYYEDTTEAVKKVQMKQNSQIKKHPMGPQEFH